MAWYKVGDDGAQAAKQDDEKRQSDFDSPRRFWLKPDTSTKMIFLDSIGFFFREHQLKIGGSWMNWETCISDLGEEDCPICEAGFKYSYVAGFTIIDLSKYVSKSGKKVTASKKLLMLKAGARNKILKRKEKLDNDLTGCVFDVTRFTSKECSTGEDFDFLKRATIDEIKELCPEGVDPVEFITPFEYAKLFKPKTVDELRKVIGASAPIGAGIPPEAIPQDNIQKPASLKDLL
jgi:hypothetical protein